MVKLPSEILAETSNPRLKELVDITSPTAFRRGLKEAKKGGFTREESKAFSLGKAAATLQLMRKNISPKERKQFMQIQQIRIPKINRR